MELGIGMLKPNLLKLDPRTRAFALVGGFLGTFALLEEGIDLAIAELMNLDGIKKSILGRNMTFAAKINTLRTVVSVYFQDKDKVERFHDLVKKAKDYSELRNMVAHTPFAESSKSDGVQFFRTMASKNLNYLNVDWSIDDFLEHLDLLNQLDNEIRAIETEDVFRQMSRWMEKLPKGQQTSLLVELLNRVRTGE